MPVRPLPSVALSLRLRAWRLARIAAFTLATAVALFCATLLAIRFVLYPQLELHRDDIAAMLSRELGARVEIDAIRTGWDGWNPQFTVNGLRVRDAAGALAQPLLELPQVSGAVSWTSLVAADLRLSELSIERPRLALRRDQHGRLHVGGIQIESAPADLDPRFTAWLLRQRLIVVRDALLTWNDDLRHAPQLSLDGVHLRLERGFGKHRFGLRGTPPPEIAAPIDLRGEFTGSLADWREAQGRAYLRLDFADVAAWSQWLPMPFDVRSGQGAMRVWFEFANGVARTAVADLELADVRARLAEDLPALDFARLAGRVQWRQEGERREMVTQGLKLVESDSARSTPTDLDLRVALGADGRATSGRVASSRIDLGLLASIGPRLPLSAQLRDEVARYALAGTLRDVEYVWEGALHAPLAFRSRGRFDGLASSPVDASPGLTNLSGRFDADQAGGTVQFSGRNALVTAPTVFAQPVALDSVSGRVKWARSAAESSVRIEDLQYANGHFAGSAQATWKFARKGPDEVDLAMRLSRVDATQVHHYLPSVIHPDTRAWLRDALIAGHSSDARITLKGDPARFPFFDGKGGSFLVTVDAQDATLDYAVGWPRITDLDASVRIEGNRLEVIASRGKILGATLGRTTATIADLAPVYPGLVIEGEASGPTSEFLQFVRASPVSSWTDRAIDDTHATGNGRLNLKIDLALGDPQAAANVAGNFDFSDNELRIPNLAPLAGVSGRLAFTESDFEARDVKLEAFGGSAQVTVARRGGVLDVQAAGMADLAEVHRAVGTPLAQRLTGATDYKLAMTVRNASPSWQLESSLRGATVDLPSPLRKTAAQVMPLKIERRPLDGDRTRDAFLVAYGDTARMVAHRKVGTSDAAVDRVLILLGKAAQGSAVPERTGVAVRGDVSVVNVDEWIEVANTAFYASADRGLPAGKRDALAVPELDTVDVEADKFTAFGRSFDAMSLSARRAESQWQLAFRSRQADGNARWEAAGSKLANGRFSAQLSKLDFAALRESATAAAAPLSRAEGSPNPWPALDVRAERFVTRAGDIGRMELQAHPEGADWRVDRFALINDAGRVDAQGNWRLVGQQQQTTFEVVVDVSDASAFLARLDLPGDVKGASAKLAGQIAWAGSPSDFDYAKLAGDFSVKVGAGQFTKMDPGVGKLLGVLSLQALPRRIALDFRDVFSEGFAFDTMAGNVRIASGIMRTDDLLVSGPAAKVMLSGNVDLSSETQQLSVQVQPSLSTVVSTGAGAAAVVLLAANPLVGAAVGAGTLLAQKLMRDPIEQMFSYRYVVRGSWSDPVVERVFNRPPERLGEASQALRVEQ